ncbi:mutator type transposase [Tanacetum coccineum]
MVKQRFELNVPKDSSNIDEAAQNGGTPKSVTFEIHHGGCFTPTPSRSYVGGQVSSVNVVDIDEFCLHDLKDVMAKYVKDNKIILIYVEHGSSNVDSSIFVTHNKGVTIAVDNHLRKAHIEIDSSPDVNRNLTLMCHRNLTKKSADDPFGDLNEILGDYANTGKQITKKHHVGNSSTVVDVPDLQMLFEREGVGPIGKFKKVEVYVDDESEEESDIEGNDTSCSDSDHLDYDTKHDQVFDDDEHIVEDVHVSMNNFSFTADPKHDLSIDERFLALGWHLDEIHVTWAHLEKKRTRLRLYTIYLEEFCLQGVETVSQTLSDGVRIFKVELDTYYELLKGKKPELKYFRVFGSLCYPTNDYDDLGKLKAKADIGIFVGYAPTKKAYRIFNKRTRKIQETVHVTFDELSEGLTSVQSSTGLEPNPMAPMHNGAGPEISALHSGRSRSELVNDPTTPSVPPSAKQLEDLFQPLFDDDEEFPPAVQTPPVPITSSSESQTPPPDTGVTGIETSSPINDSDLFEPYIALETASAASSSGTVIVDVTLNSPITHVQK